MTASRPPNTVAGKDFRPIILVNEDPACLVVPADSKYGTLEAFVAEATSNLDTEKARFAAAAAQLKKLSQVDGKKVAAIGYCFGGAVVLDMARSGEDLAAVATFQAPCSRASPRPKEASSRASW